MFAISLHVIGQTLEDDTTTSDKPSNAQRRGTTKRLLHDVCDLFC